MRGLLGFDGVVPVDFLLAQAPRRFDINNRLDSARKWHSDASAGLDTK